MQAWVTSNGLSNGHSHSHSQPIASTPAPDDHDAAWTNSAYHQTQPSLPSTQALPASQQPRARVININAGGVAGSKFNRIPPRASRLGHLRETALALSHNGDLPPPNPPQTRDKGPFWEGSTIEGSLQSDTASNLDVGMSEPPRYHAPIPEPSYKQRENLRHRPPKLETLSQDQQPPFIIGSTGVIGNAANSLGQRASTPDARNYHNGLKAVPPPNSDQGSEDSLYQTSPERTSPSNKRLHGPKLPVRTSRRGSSGSAAYPPDDTLPPPMRQVYQNVENEVEPPVDGGHLKMKARESQRSANFADTNAALGDHPDESDGSADRQPTPKAAGKIRPQVARQLFSRNGTHNIRPHEGTIPRQTSGKRHSGAKKRSFDLDYDDSALANMSYAELKKQPFDYDPTQADARSVDVPPLGTLPEKLEHFLEKDQATQVDFFTNMPVKDWEDSGDWILDRFGDVMRRLREARQAKRATAEKFENEIAERETAVSQKIHGIDQRLADLKSQGEGLVQGRQVDSEEEEG